MKKDQFQKEYHGFHTYNEREAMLHAWLVNSMADGFRVVIVQFANLGYCLMLEEAAEMMGPLLGIVTEKKQL